MTDTTAEAVDRLASRHTSEADAWASDGAIHDLAKFHRASAATLRALAAERDTWRQTAMDAAQRLMVAETERDAALAECERLRLGGCARGQTTTQWCAEAVEMMAQRDAAVREARHYHTTTDNLGRAIAVVAAERDAALAREARLREALRLAVPMMEEAQEALCGRDDVFIVEGEDGLMLALDAARAALGGEPAA